MSHLFDDTLRDYTDTVLASAWPPNWRPHYRRDKGRRRIARARRAALLAAVEKMRIAPDMVSRWVHPDRGGWWWAWWRNGTKRGQKR